MTQAMAPATQSYDAAFGTLASLFARDLEARGLSPADRAELRRLEAAQDKVLPPAFWRLLATVHVVPAQERAFAVVVRAMAETDGAGQAPIGRALATTGYAEARLIRLLRARGLDEVAWEAGLAARWCAAKGLRPRFADEYRRDGFGGFIMAAALASRDADTRADAIARSYFAHPTPDARGDAPPETTDAE